jgi:hypothetical protein
MHLIDYGHLRDGVLYHGTLSDMDGSPKATWTYEDGGEKVTRDQPIDAATFSALWNGVADSEVFRRCMVRGPDQQIDPARYHVVGVVFQQEGQQGQYLFLVPATERDPGFVRWLQLLNVPQGSA